LQKQKEEKFWRGLPKGGFKGIVWGLTLWSVWQMHYMPNLSSLPSVIPEIGERSQNLKVGDLGRGSSEKRVPRGEGSVCGGSCRDIKR